MPCRDGGPCEKDESQRWQALQDRADLVTRLLCEVLNEQPKVLKIASYELFSWWEEHKKADSKRKTAEEKALRDRREYDMREAQRLEIEAKALRLKWGKK